MGWFSDIFKGIGDFFEGVVDTIVNIGKGIFNFIGDVFSFVVNPFGAPTVPNVSVNAGEQAKGITITKNGVNFAIPLIYGYRRLGGSIVFAETEGDNNKYLYVCYVLCQGEIKGVRRLFVDDIELPTAMFTGTDNTLPAGSIITPSTGRYKNLAKFQVFYGASGDTQSTLLNESANWEKQVRTLPGIAYLACRFEYPEIKTQEDQDNNPWSGGIPRIQAEVFGKKVFDVSLGSFAAGTTYANLPKTYSLNPVNHLMDYLLDPNFGCGISSDEIDQTTFRISARKCNQYVTYYSGQQGRALPANQVIQTENKLIDNVKEMVKSCRGIMPYVQGSYQLKIEDGGNETDITSSSATVVYSVTDDDIIGGISLRGEAKNTKYNQVVVNYIEPDTDFQNQSIAYPVTDSVEHVAALAADNGEVLKGEMNFPSITNKYLAEDLAKMIFEKSRNQRQISFTGRPELMTVIPGDIIYITNARLGLTNEAFRVVGMNVRIDSTVSIEAVEHNPTVYPYITQDEKDRFENPSQQDPLLPDPVTPTQPDQPVGVVPPIDPDPISPDDPNAPETDSAGYPVAPIQNPVPPPAPDETQMPDPLNVPLKVFQGPRQFNNFLTYTLDGSEPFAVTAIKTGVDQPVGTAVYLTSREIGTDDPTTVANFGVEHSKRGLTTDILFNTLEFRNEMVRRFNKQPFSQFQCIGDDTGNGTNPWYTNGEYGGIVVDTSTRVDYPNRSPGDLLTVTAIDVQQDSAGEKLPPLITFSAPHNLADFDRIKATNQQMGNWTDTSYKGNAVPYPTDLVMRNFQVKVINSTQVELYYYGYTNTQDFSVPFSFFNYVEFGWVPPTWATEGGKTNQFQIINADSNDPVISTIPSTIQQVTFEKLKTFKECSIYNPYEAWTRDQDVSIGDSAGTVTPSPNIGQLPTVEFEAPVDREILKRGPKGLYPKVFCNPPVNEGGIVIYKGTVGGGLTTQGYVFGLKNTKWNPSTFEGSNIFAWPWAGGNKQGINPLLLVTSPRDFFKIRFTDAQFNADGSLYWEGANLYSDGSRPTPQDDKMYWDPATRYDLPGWTYTNERGESVTGYGLEAYLNYSIQQLSADSFETNEDTTTEHGLGD